MDEKDALEQLAEQIICSRREANSQQRLLELTFDAVPLPMWIKDLTPTATKMAWLNRAASLRWGVDRKLYMNQPDAIIWGANVAAEFEVYDREVIAHSPIPMYAHENIPHPMNSVESEKPRPSQWCVVKKAIPLDSDGHFAVFGIAVAMNEDGWLGEEFGAVKASWSL